MNLLICLSFKDEEVGSRNKRKVYSDNFTQRWANKALPWTIRAADYREFISLPSSDGRDCPH